MHAKMRPLLWYDCPGSPKFDSSNRGCISANSGLYFLFECRYDGLKKGSNRFYLQTSAQNSYADRFVNSLLELSAEPDVSKSVKDAINRVRVRSILVTMPSMDVTSHYNLLSSCPVWEFA